MQRVFLPRTAARPGERAPLLDVLRCFAVFAVLVEHFGVRHWFDPIGLGGLNFGTIGVRAFFVLSGFLITGILLKYRDALAEGTSTAFTAIKQFFTRRVLRIFPVYFLVLFVCWFLGVEVARAHIGWFVSFLSNVQRALTNNDQFPLGHFWSLAVEEQFYLTWPFFIVLAPKRYLFAGTVVAVFIGLFTRIWLQRAGYGEFWLGLTPCCFDSLGIGALTALARQDPAVHRKWTGVITVLGFGIGLPTLIFHFFKSGEGGIGTFYANFFYAAIVDRCYDLRFANKKWSGLVQPLVYLGTISYGIYVIHVPAWSAFHRLMYVSGYVVPTPLQAPVGMAIVVGLASISWHVMERPLLLLRKGAPVEKRRGPASEPLQRSTAPTGRFVVQLMRASAFAILLALLVYFREGEPVSNAAAVSFERTPPQEIASLATNTSKGCSLDAINKTGDPAGWTIRRGEIINVGGWALDTATKTTSPWVVLQLSSEAANGSFFAATRSRGARDDLTKFFGDGPGVSKANFELLVGTNQLEPGRYTMTLIHASSGGGLHCDTSKTLVVTQ